MEEKQILKVPSTITKITTMSDKTLRLQVDTQELMTEDEAIVMALRDKLGIFAFVESEMSKDDLKDLPEVKLEAKEKSPSERLRARMYVYFTEHLRKDNQYFNNWYSSELNRIGERYLEKLK